MWHYLVDFDFRVCHVAKVQNDGPKMLIWLWVSLFWVESWNEWDPTKTRAKWMTFLSPLFRCVHLPSQPASFAWWHLSSSEVGATVTFPDGTLWSFSPKVIFVLLTCADCREISIYISMSLISVSGTR